MFGHPSSDGNDIPESVDLLLAMWTCAQPYCAGWYWQGKDRIANTLACVRFSADLLSQSRDCWPVGGPPLLWTQVDLYVLPRIASFGFSAHLHGPVTHLHGTPPAWAAKMTEQDWLSEALS